ncbi:unnamed protein product [Penicillium glandicola]
MAPVPGLFNTDTLSPRADKKYEVDMERELFLSKFLLGIIVVIIGVFFGCTIYLKLKPKYDGKWKPKLEPKLRDCKEKYWDWKTKMGTCHGPKEPKVPAPAHVAGRAFEAPVVNQITTDLTPEYLRMSTAVIV